ncbi:MAG: ABC transporter ATP-binding protein [Candidatus Izemoplasmatales bacterium]|nr:ABC transporter ATP-binding protein [Candidatus Izemoplasmatales bacterium]
MIKTEMLTKKFSDNRGVFSVNLNVPKGAIYGFVGHNGAGKTTTIKMLCGLLKSDSGKAFINGLEVIPKNIPQIKRTIGYMPDITGVYPQMSVWEFLDFYGAAFKIPPKKRKQRIEEVLDITHSTEMLDYQVASLSRGMRQRIGLAKTLIHDPPVLILDEPAGGLDPNARIEMRQTIARLREIGKTIMLSSHILPELSSVCDVVGIIFKGKLLAQGTVDEISRQLQENMSIEITVDSDIDRLITFLEGAGNIVGIKKTDENQVQILYSGARDTVSSLLNAIIATGIPLRFFKEVEADLENVFMDIITREKDK